MPHPSLADEAYRKIKGPLVVILEEILGNLEEQGLASRQEMKRIRDVLEEQYGIYPQMGLADRAGIVAERRARYGGVQRLYSLRPLRSLADVQAMEVRSTWKQLIELSVGTEPQSERIEALAQRALEHDVRIERVVL